MYRHVSTYLESTRGFTPDTRNSRTTETPVRSSGYKVGLCKSFIPVIQSYIDDQLVNTILRQHDVKMRFISRTFSEYR